MTPRLCLDASTFFFRSLDAQAFLDQKPEGPALPEMRNTRSDQREAASSPPSGVVARKIRKISRPLVLKYTNSTVQQSQSPQYPVPSTQHPASRSAAEGPAFLPQYHLGSPFNKPFPCGSSAWMPGAAIPTGALPYPLSPSEDETS